MLLPRPRAVEISAARAAGPALADQLAALGSHGPFGPPWAGLWCACNFSAYCMECKRIKEPPLFAERGTGCALAGRVGWDKGLTQRQLVGLLGGRGRQRGGAPARFKLPRCTKPPDKKLPIFVV